MIKIIDIEALLASPNEMDIDIWDVPLETIREVEKLFGGEVLFSEAIDNHWITINSKTVTLTLNSMQKTKGDYKLPKLNLNI